jgi:hypothetical protein
MNLSFFKYTWFLETIDFQVREALLRRHRHQHERRKEASTSNMSRLPIIRSLAEIGRNHSSSKSKCHYCCVLHINYFFVLWAFFDSELDLYVLS